MFLAPTPYLALLVTMIFMLAITFFVILRRSDD
jgi:preprotein translocase subunit YajC